MLDRTMLGKILLGTTMLGVIATAASVSMGMSMGVSMIVRTEVSALARVDVLADVIACNLLQGSSGDS